MVTPDSLKTDAKRKTGKIKAISAVVTALPRLGTVFNYDLSRGGHEIVETTSENSYYTLTCSS